MTFVLVLLAFGLGKALLCKVPSNRWGYLEHLMVCTAVGLGVLAYALFVVGLLGWLNPLSFAVFGILVAPIAVWGINLYVQHWLDSPEPDNFPNLRDFLRPSWLAACLATLSFYVFIWGFLSPQPPAVHEWDSLSYHLAVPKLWILMGRIAELPTDHHSYFPFLAQMLYMAVLRFESVTVKSLHGLCGLIGLGATYCIARTWCSKRAAYMAVAILALTPMILWEAGTAYIELTQMMYVVLALLMVFEYWKERRPLEAGLTGALTGLALSVKTLSLVPATAICVLFLSGRPKPSHVLGFLMYLVLLGSPFYIRTYLLTGNPVYPFAYSVFGGKYWDAKRAEAYSGEQRSYGLDGRMYRVGDDVAPTRAAYVEPSLADRLRAVLLAPFGLVSLPRLYHNYNDPWPLATLGFLATTVPWLLLLHPRPPTIAWTLLLVSGFWLVVWAFTMQYARYLLPALPLAVIAGAAGVDYLTKRFKLSHVVFALAVGTQAAIVLPHALGYALEPKPPDEQINIYTSCTWINNNSRPSDGVVLFEETRGYYLDRYVMWGNSMHSTYIPYDDFRSSAEMVSWFLDHNVRFAIVNLQFAPQAATPSGSAALREAVRYGATPLLLIEWYRNAAQYGEKWRPLLADAVRRGHAVVVPAASANGAVVLRFQRPRERASHGR